MLQLVSSVIRRNLTAACRVCYILIFTGLTFRSECSLKALHDSSSMSAGQSSSVFEGILHSTSFSDTHSRQRLRSASRHLLSVPCHRRTFTRRAFVVGCPTAWNSLPDDVRNPSCSNSYFGRFLKSILCSFY